MASTATQLTGYDDACQTVAFETGRLLKALDSARWCSAGDLILSARAVFVIGGGRSGLAAKMIAMRLMHLGLRVHVAGEATAPAIQAGDVLLAVSGSGTTRPIVDAAVTAVSVDASVVAVTSNEQAPLVEYAREVLILEAADKQDHSGSVTSQYAGSLFEQGVLLAFDALFECLRIQVQQSAETLWQRHANIG